MRVAQDGPLVHDPMTWWGMGREAGGGRRVRHAAADGCEGYEGCEDSEGYEGYETQGGRRRRPPRAMPSQVRDRALGTRLPAERLGHDQRLAAVADTELAVDAAHMALDGPRRDEELIGDLLVGEPPAETIEHVTFA